MGFRRDDAKQSNRIRIARAIGDDFSDYAKGRFGLEAVQVQGRQYRGHAIDQSADHRTQKIGLILVAAEAGVSTRTIYERYKNKADLLGAVIGRP